MIQVYKILHNHEKTTNAKLLELSNYNRTRGNNLKLFKKESKTQIRKNSFCIRVTEPWNSLPNEVIMSPSVNSFKRRINKHWKYHPMKFTPSCYSPNNNINELRNRRTPRSTMLTIGPDTVS